MSELRRAARYYADERNWKIIPLRPGDKTPLTSHGVKDATTDAAQIDAWWTQWPNANIGFACGGEDGTHVIDVDVDTEKEIDGWKTINELTASGNILPKTVYQNTPRGGAHFFYHTKDRPKNKNSFMPGIDIRSEGYYVVLPPSVHPNGGVYQWATGLAPWEHPLVEYPDFMRPKERKAEPCKQPVMPVVTAPDDEIGPRAALYLAECDPAIQGLGGHDKLLWAASAMVNGFGCSDSQAFDLLSRYYNPMCRPPWNLDDPADLKDFKRKITEARKNPPRDKPLGWLTNDPSYATTSSEITPELQASADSIMQNFHRKQAAEKAAAASDPIVIAPSAADMSEEMRFLCHPTGLLGEICSWINSTCIRPQPFLTLACALTFCGALFGRKIKDALDSRTNLYCMGVGKSSSGKNHAPKQIRQICEKVGCMNLIGGDDVASDSAIEKTLAEHPATLYLWDEIGHMITSMKHGGNSHKAGVVTLLMKLYSSAGIVYKGKEYATQEQRTINQPCCCLYGMSTPDRFAEGIDPAELQDGWLGRCLVFQANGRPEKERNRADIPIPEGVIEKVSAWYNHTIMPENPKLSDLIQGTTAGGYTAAPPKLIEVPIDPDAEQLFVDYDKEASKAGKEEPVVDCLWAKAEENARKIALIVAASESYEQSRITLSVADYSVRLTRYLLIDFADEVVPKIASSKTAKDKLKISNVIDGSGVKGLTKSEVTRKTQWSETRQRSSLLGDLIEAGEIVMKPMAGNKGARYWTAKNYNTYTTKQQQEPPSV